MRGQFWRNAALGIGLASLLGSAGAARADNVAAQLNALEAEAHELGTTLPQLQASSEVGQKRLVDSVVAYRLGDYAASATALFELVGQKQLVGPDLEQAEFYLAESLYQKGDRGAARAYYTQLTASGSTAGKYYTPALLRLIEIAIHQKDDASELLAALDRSSSSSPQALYIRGKYAFSANKLDDAISYFAQVPKGSDWDLEAQYYSATTSVAKKDLPTATQRFTQLSEAKPRTANDRRVIELSQLALGRLFYEQDQFSKSIEAYLLVDRKSDLFSDALFEVGWVYVKNKQFDKALRALELLAASDPSSQKTPTVKLLEGNLRIRKAQMLRKDLIEGTRPDGTDGTDGTATPDSVDAEYDKASALFAEVHAAYSPAYQSLAAIVAAKGDPTPYLMQVAGRPQPSFQATTPLPDVAAQWLREEPAVERFVSIETDLGEVQANLDTAEQIVARLDAVLAAPDHAAIYPQFAQRTNRIGQMQNDLVKIRADLADQELRLVDSNGELAGLTSNRKTLQQQFANLNDPERAYGDRVIQNHKDYDAADTKLADIASAQTTTQAMAVALRKYALDVPTDSQALTADLRTSIASTLDQVAQESQSIDAELASIKRESQLDRDMAGANDEQIASARALRKQLIGALDAEHRVLAGFASASRDSGKSKALAGMGDQAARISQSLDQVEATIGSMVDKSVANAKQQLTAETQQITELRTELSALDTEAKEAGTTVVADSFARVKDKLYDVVIRADVGTVDVAWSQKSDTDDDLKRFNLNRTRELKQLKDEFKDILDGGVPKPSAPKPKDEGMPKPTLDGPAQSPDKGGATGRVKPVGEGVKKSTDPKVKPDEGKTDPKKTDPKKTGAH